MKITYIFHSGFLAELPHMTLLFDYYRGDVPSVRKDLPLYIFASHSHGDHFNKKVFRLAGEARRVRYIFSSDISRSAVPAELRENTVFMGPDETVEFGMTSEEKITVRTLRSNDLGVAFVLEAEGKKIYFAGDLNNWWWDGDDEDRQLEQAYHKELEKIRGESFDVAFVPLDPRISGYEKGIEDFLNYAAADVIFPMHFGDHYEVIEKMQKRGSLRKNNVKLVNIKEPGQKVVIDDNRM